MTFLAWAILLIVIGVVVFVAEVFVPSGGVLGVLAGLCLMVGVLMLFAVNKWAGGAAFLALAIGVPFAFTGAMNVWQKTPAGKRMILTDTAPQDSPALVLVGETGVTVTDLRPMGEAEFEGRRVQAINEAGVVVPAGTPVRVLAVTDRVATVRVIA